MKWPKCFCQQQQKVAKVLKTIIIELAIWNPEWNMWLQIAMLQPDQQVV
jgi:hypothetical protein